MHRSAGWREAEVHDSSGGPGVAVEEHADRT